MSENKTHVYLASDTETSAPVTLPSPARSHTENLI